MKNIITMTLILIFTVACGMDEQNPYKGMGIDDRLLDHVETFESITDREVNIPIVVEDISDSSTLGSCIVYPDGSKAVVVDEVIFNTPEDDYTQYELEVIILHELGHCILNKKHNNKRVIFEEMSIAKSMMNSQVVYIHHYINYREYYQAKLTNPDLNIEEFYN